jgi:hypothetical protein
MTQTTNLHALFPPICRYNDADNMIKDLPQEDELTIRELAIHRRAYIDGVRQGERQEKQRILHNFQMSIIGHVL